MARGQAQRNNRGNAYTIIGMAAGAAIGAGVALVYTPGKGEENRRRLLEWAQARLAEAQGQVESRVSGVQTQVQDRAGGLQNKAQQVASRSAEWASHRAAEARNKAEEMTGAATQKAQPAVKQEPSSALSEDITAETAAGDIRIVPEDHTTENGGQEC